MASSLLGELRFEVIPGQICGNGFDEAEECISMSRLEITQKLAIIGTKFEIGLLNEIVHRLRRDLAKMLGRANNDRRYDPMKTADKLVPGFNICRGGTELYQFWS